MSRSPKSLPIPLPLDPALERWSLVVVATIAAAVALTTFAYGGVEAWVQPLLVAAAGFLAIAAARVRGLPRLSWITAAIALLVAITAAQLVPLPMTVLETLSPARALTLRELGAGAPAWAPLSYYPPYTRQGLTSLLVAGAVFASVAATVRSTAAVTWLLTALFVIGVAQSLLAIFQVVSEAPGIYWDALIGRGPWAGSFLNHSNFCQFINATIGAGLGLLLIRSSTERRHASRLSGGGSASTYFQKHGSVLVGLAVQVVAIALSLSRGGVLGGCVAAAVVVLMLGRRRQASPVVWALIGAPVLAAAALLAIGADAVYDRIGTLDERATYSDRLELSKATARVGLRHLATGTGLGTHRYAFPAYDTTGSPALAEQADNDYAQLFEEMGAPGLVAVIVFVAGLLIAAMRTIRTSRSSIRYALYSVVYAVVACAVQSVTDYGLRLPAIYFTLAALAGLVPAIIAITAAEAKTLSARPSLQVWGAAAVILAVAGGLGYQAWLDYRGERWFSVARATERLITRGDWVVTSNDYVNLLTAAEAAATIRPADVEYAYWLNAYRWQAFTIGINPSEAVATAEGADVATRLVGEIGAAQRLCPTFGPLFTLEGQVLLALGDQRAFTQVTKGHKLSPNDPEACYIAGYAACLRDPPDRQRAEALLTRACDLSPSLFGNMLRIWLHTYDDAEFPIRLAEGNLDRLQLIAQVLKAIGDHDDTVEQLTQAAADLARERVAAGQATPTQIAATASRSAAAGRLEEAVGLFRQALARQHANVNWRLELTDVLARLERYEEAIREARLCLRLKPGWQPAIQRIERLSLLAPPEGQPLPALPSGGSESES